MNIVERINSYLEEYAGVTVVVALFWFSGGLLIYLHESIWDILLGIFLIIAPILGYYAIHILGSCLEAGFRNQFPFDFMIHVAYEREYLQSCGFIETGISDAGTDKPSVEFYNAATQTKATVILDAPINGSFTTHIIIQKGEEVKEVSYNTAEDTETKRVYLDEISTIVNNLQHPCLGEL